MDYTPMIQQYLNIKEENKDCILFFRLGDFYEMFFEDALIASKELEIVLTKKSCGDNRKCDMCGVPYHVSDEYVKRLVEKGYKVAICEQLEDPKKVKGLVKRGVIQIVTPGTLLNNDKIEQGNHNYLLSVLYKNNRLAFSYIDITTGSIYYTEKDLSYNDEVQKIIENEIARIHPSEIIINNFFEDDKYKSLLENKYNLIVTFTKNIMKSDALKIIESNLNVALNSIHLKDFSLANLLNYVFKYQESRLNHIKPPIYYEINKFLNLDAHSIDHLELHKNLYTNNQKGSLFGTLNHTCTSMGTRLLHEYIEKPLTNITKINERLDLIEDAIEHQDLQNSISHELKGIYDLERILAKMAYQSANARDMVALKYSLEKLPAIYKLLSEHSQRYQQIAKKIDILSDLRGLISDSIVEEPPLLITEGNIIKEGFDHELDLIRRNKIDGKKELIQYEIDLKNQLGIKNLKIVYNKKLGYFIDITKSNLSKVPDTFMRRQTLTNSERYKTLELENIEEKILSSDELIFQKEYEIFNDIRTHILDNIKRIQETSRWISYIDVIQSLAHVAYHNQYVRPGLNNEGIINLYESRHPVIEESIGFDQFITNDVSIGETDNLIQIITGPNMSGKSTYLRQVALIVIMAQIGSFVPAKTANIGIVDKIFTRIGASDNLYRGESTFMVEMNEMSSIIKQATSKSLLILDEVGRGTSTFDGLSIAWSIVEYISEKIGSKTLFATHYHELSQLENQLNNVINLKIEIKEINQNLIFMRKIKKGTANKSYGIEVAKLAGLPDELIQRANTILKSVEKHHNQNDEIEIIRDAQVTDSKHTNKYYSIILALRKIDINHITPIEAMLQLSEFVKKSQENEDNNDQYTK